MKNKFQILFPNFKTRMDVLKEIQSSPALLSIFQEWTDEQKEEFLAFTTGARGMKILYDSFFKEIFNPETVPERLNALLSLLLGRSVRILKVLPNDNSRLGDETSLVIMDMVVQLDDGSIVDVEIQKIGYLFPGQRSACYAADLLLRQYKSARAHMKDKKKRFSYKNIHDVYTIVFFEKSPDPFHSFPKDYVHYFEPRSDTGLKLDLLQKYYFIPLDIFHKNLQNRGILSELDAWLAFLGCDDPNIIADIISKYPAFTDMYRHIFDICQNTERVMEMFSKELRELDRNTVQLMIDEMQEDLLKQKSTIDEQKSTIDEQKSTIDEQKSTIDEQKSTIDEQKSTIDEQKSTIDEQKNMLDEKDQLIESLQKQLAASQKK